MRTKAKRNRAGLATKEQLEALGKRYAYELWKQGITFEQLYALYHKKGYEKDITRSTLEIVKGFAWTEHEVRIPRNATWEGYVDGAGWEIIGNKPVISALVTREQKEGPVTVVQVRVPTSLILPGNILDIKIVLQVYKEMAIKPDLLSQVIINIEEKVFEPNITVWEIGDAILGLQFIPRYGEKEDRKVIIPNYIGDRVPPHAWIVGVRI